jgi:hypothetical protein
MNNINKQFLPLFGTPMYIKYKEELKSEKNLNLETQYKFQNFSQIEKTEYIVNGLNYLGNDYKNNLKQDLNTVLLLIQKEKLDYFIKTNLDFFNSKFAFFTPIDINGIKYYNYNNLLSLDAGGKNLFYSNLRINKSLLMFKQLYRKGIMINLALEDLINSKKLEINKLLEVVNNQQNKLNISNPLLNSLGLEKEMLKTNLETGASNINKSEEQIDNVSSTKLNLIKIEETINQVIKNNKFDIEKNTFATRTLPGFITPRINDYIKSMTMFNMKRKGTILVYSKTIGYYFNTLNHKLLINIFNFLTASFRTLHCLISKPVFVVTPDKVEIQLFYYFLDPKKNLKKEKWVLGGSYKRAQVPSIVNTNVAGENQDYKDKIISRLVKFHFKLIKIKDKNVIIWRKNFIARNANKLKKICDILSRFLKKPVELNLIRLRYPYNDTNILVNLLSIMIKRTKIRIFLNKLFRRAVIKNPFKINFNLKGPKKVMVLPAFLSGMKIRIAGRLLTQRVVPRKTVKTTIRGALATGKVNYSEVARLTKKNKRGAFSITVTSGHNYL